MTYISSIADESDEFSLLAPQAGGAAPSFRSLPSQSAFSDLLIRAVILSRAAKHVERRENAPFHPEYFVLALPLPRSRSLLPFDAP